MLEPVNCPGTLYLRLRFFDWELSRFVYVQQAGLYLKPLLSVFCLWLSGCIWDFVRDSLLKIYPTRIAVVTDLMWKFYQV